MFQALVQFLSTHFGLPKDMHTAITLAPSTYMWHGGRLRAGHEFPTTGNSQAHTLTHNLDCGFTCFFPHVPIQTWLICVQPVPHEASNQNLDIRLWFYNVSTTATYNTHAQRALRYTHHMWGPGQISPFRFRPFGPATTLAAFAVPMVLPPILRAHGLQLPNRHLKDAAAEVHTPLGTAGPTTSISLPVDGFDINIIDAHPWPRLDQRHSCVQTGIARVHDRLMHVALLSDFLVVGPGRLVSRGPMFLAKKTETN